jgi:hypothetical protein
MSDDAPAGLSERELRAAVALIQTAAELQHQIYLKVLRLEALVMIALIVAAVALAAALLT